MDKRKRKKAESWYLAITTDKYELPLFATDSLAEMCQMTGKTKGQVLSCISHDRSGRNDGYKLIRIPKEEDDDDGIDDADSR